VSKNTIDRHAHAEYANRQENWKTTTN